jgi:YihY family inner membrane protein
MSTATLVPETYELDGDDALQTLRRVGWGRLVKDSFVRFRYADGFSHCRALAFQITLALLPGIIAVVGLATVLHAEHFRDVLRQTATRLAPGPAGNVIVTAIQHGQRAAGGGARAALTFGLLAALVSATTAMGQVERGANRIYGVERDRPTLRKYTVGFLLACSAGLAMVFAVVLIVAGQDIAKAIRLSGLLEDAWIVLRWPLAVALLVTTMALLFRASPRRHQPAASWLAVGSAVSILLALAFTWLLSLYLNASRTFGQTYGPLAGLIGVLVWAFLMSLAIFLGLAFAAQLEAVRAGQPVPITGERVNREGSQPRRSSLRGSRMLGTWR